MFNRIPVNSPAPAPSEEARQNMLPDSGYLRTPPPSTPPVSQPETPDTEIGLTTEELAGKAAWFRDAEPETPAPCIGNDPNCPCQDGDLCHYKGKDAWPVTSPAPTYQGIADAMAEQWGSLDSDRKE